MTDRIWCLGFRGFWGAGALGRWVTGALGYAGSRARGGVRTPRPHTGGSLTRHDTFRAPRARWSAWVTRLRGSFGHAVTRCVWSRGYAGSRARGGVRTPRPHTGSLTRHDTFRAPRARWSARVTRARGLAVRLVTRLRGLAGSRWSADASSAHFQPNQTRHLQSTASPRTREPA